MFAKPKITNGKFPSASSVSGAFPSVFPPVSSTPHMETHMYMDACRHTRAQTHTHTDRRGHTHTRAQTRTHRHAQTHTDASVHGPRHTDMHGHRHAHVHRCTHSRIQARTHTDTHAYTVQTQSRAPTLPWGRPSLPGPGMPVGCGQAVQAASLAHPLLWTMSLIPDRARSSSSSPPAASGHHSP